MIELIKAAILGIIQGLTEFLPISSSGHLILGQHFLNFEMPGISFEVMLHLGTLIAVLIYFRKDVFNIVGAFFTFRSDEVYASRRKTGWLLLVATIVTGGLYFAFQDSIKRIFETESHLSLYVVCVFLIITGFMNYISDKIIKNKDSAHELGIRKAAIIGIGQAFALNPGISRSGSTITFGLLVGLKRSEVATFSFLLSIPAIIGATINEIPELLEASGSYLLIYLTGGISAFITGYLIISFLIKILNQRRMKIFAYWCWFIALISAILIYTSS